MFTISATGLNSDRTLSLNYTVAEVTGSNVDIISQYRTDVDTLVAFTDPDSDGTYTGELTIDLVNDRVGETTGEISVTLNADPETLDTYTLGDTAAATTKIYDDEKPVIVVESAGDVTEGTDTNATFNFIARASPNKSITVNYSLAKTTGRGHFFDEAANLGDNKTLQLDFTGNKTLHALNILLIDDDGHEEDVTITLTLKDDSPVGDEYYIDSEDNDASIAIANDDAGTVISVEEAPTSVLAGDSFTFKVKATPPLETSESLSFIFNIGNVGETTYYNSINPSIQTPRLLSGVKRFRSFNLLLAPIETGMVALIAMVEIQIQFRSAVSSFLYTYSNTPTIVQIIDPDLNPAVSISRVSPGTIEEGETALFDLTPTNPADISEDITVTYSVSQSGTGDFVTTGTTFTETIDATTNKGRIEIDSTADLVDEDNTTVTVTVLADPNTSDANNAVRYTVGTPPSQNVNINDNDGGAGLPVASVTRTIENVYEGENAEFRFAITNPPSGDNKVTLNYTITQVGDYLGNFTGPSESRTIEIGSSGFETITLETIPDGVVEDNGSVTVQVVGETGGTTTYSVGETYQAVTTLVSEDDPNLSSISIAVMGRLNCNDY